MAVGEARVGSTLQFTVRAYDALTGKVQWTNMHLPAGASSSTALSVSAANGVVAVAGTTADSSGTQAVVRSYIASSGHLERTQTYAGTANSVYLDAFNTTVVGQSDTGKAILEAFD